jgi:hypothetical protein
MARRASSLSRAVRAMFFMFLAAAFLSVTSVAQINITLKNSFIENFKNRATITTTFTVDKAHKKPNAASSDGDMHIAGRAPQIGLATVAEIMNAASEPASVDLVHSVEGTTKTLAITGAWRIWCEHGGDSQQVQGAKLAKFTTTNPDHVFEIHPIIQLNDNDVRETFHTIDGFTPKDAHDAFMSYENKKSQISADSKTTTITTTMGGYNYVDFLMRPTGKPFQAQDGRFVLARVYDLEGEVLVHNRRMVFVKGTPPDTTAGTLDGTACYRVLGVPRIDLALISWRTHNAKTRPGVLTWSLPYEMIIVAAQEQTCPEE